MDDNDSTATITVTPDGPYLADGRIPLIRRRVIHSEHGEPITWQTTTRLEAGRRYALCRCGQSARKPYCDGTHTKAGFDGRLDPPAATYDERSRPIAGTGIIIRDDRGICVHAGFCGNRISNVWEMVGGSGTEDSVTRAQVMAMVERCPSGALTYRLTDDGEDIEPELAAEIGVIDDGPLWVTGSIEVRSPDGTAIETRNRVTLCRCGQSRTKPLCDGSHRDAGFRDS